MKMTMILTQLQSRSVQKSNFMFIYSQKIGFSWSLIKSRNCKWMFCRCFLVFFFYTRCFKKISLEFLHAQPKLVLVWIMSAVQAFNCPHEFQHLIFSFPCLANRSVFFVYRPWCNSLFLYFTDCRANLIRTTTEQGLVTNLLRNMLKF